jgi:hypothetical protein
MKYERQKKLAQELDARIPRAQGRSEHGLYEHLSGGGKRPLPAWRAHGRGHQHSNGTHPGVSFPRLCSAHPAAALRFLQGPCLSPAFGARWGPEFVIRFARMGYRVGP